MRKPALTALLVSLVLAGCGGQSSPPPSPPPSTPTPASQATATLQAGPGLSLANGCKLLNSQEVSHVSPELTRPEVTKPTFDSKQVEHPVFSEESLPVKEVSCRYYIYYRANYIDSQMTQVTYWLDLPDKGASSAAHQVWADVVSKAAQQVPGVGDSAIYDSGHNGRLTFKKGEAFVTMEVLGTNLDASKPGGRDKQIEMEKNMALVALTRFK